MLSNFLESSSSTLEIQKLKNIIEWQKTPHATGLGKPAQPLDALRLENPGLYLYAVLSCSLGVLLQPAPKMLLESTGATRLVYTMLLVVTQTLPR